MRKTNYVQHAEYSWPLPTILVTVVSDVNTWLILLDTYLYTEPSVRKFFLCGPTELICNFSQSEEISPYNLCNSQSMIICLWLQHKQSFVHAHSFLVVHMTEMKQGHSLFLEALQDGIYIIKGFINFLSYFCSWN